MTLPSNIANNVAVENISLFLSLSKRQLYGSIGKSRKTIIVYITTLYNSDLTPSPIKIYDTSYF